jgi:hypothetical protein
VNPLPDLTDAQKAEAFDLIALAFTNRWYDGSWTWYCHTPPGGPRRATRAEAVADLIDYARREAQHLAKRPAAEPRIPLDTTGEQPDS